MGTCHCGHAPEETVNLRNERDDLAARYREAVEALQAVTRWQRGERNSLPNISKPLARYEEWERSAAK